MALFPWLLDMIRLLALDIDGTLLDSDGRDPRRPIATRSRARSTPASRSRSRPGRRYDFARPIFESLPAPLTLILSNGAIVKTRDGQTLMRSLLPRDVARDRSSRTCPSIASSAAVVFDRPREGQVVFEAIDWDHPRHAASSRRTGRS